MNYIDTRAWKKKFPQYDVSGSWNDITIYTNSVDVNGWKELYDKSIPSPVLITQTCRSVKIENSVGDDFTWHSIIAHWDNNTLEILYKVEYLGKLQREGYPEFRIGVERMNICTDTPTPTQKPQKMSGKFWQCIANDEKPIYMGDVVYERVISG